MRVTASKFSNVLSTGHCKYLIEPHRKFNPTTAMKWGINNEGKALAAYAKKIGLNEEDINRPGLILHPCGYIGGSPDGYIPKKGKLVEVKCPYKYKDSPSVDYIIDNEKFYLRRNKHTGRVQLDMSHPQGRNYWHQIQGCMCLTHVHKIDLVIWINNDVQHFEFEFEKNWAIHNLPILHEAWITATNVPRYIVDHQLPMVSSVFFLLRYTNMTSNNLSATRQDSFNWPQEHDIMDAIMANIPTNIEGDKWPNYWEEKKYSTINNFKELTPKEVYILIRHPIEKATKEKKDKEKVSYLVELLGIDHTTGKVWKQIRRYWGPGGVMHQLKEDPKLTTPCKLLYHGFNETGQQKFHELTLTNFSSEDDYLWPHILKVCL